MANGVQDPALRDGPAPQFHDEDMTAGLDAAGKQAWLEALLAARVVQLANAHGLQRRLGGIRLKARAGGVRFAYMDILHAIVGADLPWLKVTPETPISQLIGGIDTASTTAAGKLVCECGLLQSVHHGALTITMAERLPAGSASVIAAVIDTGIVKNPFDREGTITAAQFLTIAISETESDAAEMPKALSERLALQVDLDAVAWHHVCAEQSDPASCIDKFDVSAFAAPVLEQSTINPSAVQLSDAMLTFLSLAGTATGDASVRRFEQLTLVCRLLAALSKRHTASEADAVMAVRLCLGVTVQMPSGETDVQEAEQPAENPPPPIESDQLTDDLPQIDAEMLQQMIGALQEMAAAREASGSMDGLDLTAKGTIARSAGGAGKAGIKRKRARRGRPLGTSEKPPFPDARPDIAATLRAAAPWQRMRQREQIQMRGEQLADTARLLIRASDFRYKRLQHPTPSTAIFIVDASGSTALERLGETKGAIEQLLAKCYVRRDEVALIAFRGEAAQTLLEPTRSLTLAKRKLGGLPGGGPTPLADGLRTGLQLSLREMERGNTPIAVVMTDGSGNIALDGTPDRAKAQEDALQIARAYRAQGITCIMIDVARRPRPKLRELAAVMGADLEMLPRADGVRIANLVDGRMNANRPQTSVSRAMTQLSVQATEKGIPR